MTIWVAQPVFDEGEDWPESTGTPHLIEADSAAAAETMFYADHPYTGLVWVYVMTPQQWYADANGGYPLDGLPPTA